MNAFIRTPDLIQKTFPNIWWRIPTEELNIYLSFDDGPIPEITPWVLQQLSDYKAKATFFCVGENVMRNPGIFKQLIESGHTIGNHTFNHLNAWKTTRLRYYRNILSASQHIPGTLFRPPHGKITFPILRTLKQRYQIVMWDVLSRDFDREITPEQCLQNVIQNVRNGSIIVFHDSVKAFTNLQYVLPRILEYLNQCGYQFKALPMPESVQAEY